MGSSRSNSSSSSSSSRGCDDTAINTSSNNSSNNSRNSINSPNSNTNNNRPAPKSGQRLRDSCEACAVSKVRCSKSKPKCARCEQRGIDCCYLRSQRYGRLPTSSRPVNYTGPPSKRTRPEHNLDQQADADSGTELSLDDIDIKRGVSLASMLPSAMASPSTILSGLHPTMADEMMVPLEHMTDSSYETPMFNFFSPTSAGTDLPMDPHMWDSGLEIARDMCFPQKTWSSVAHSVHGSGEVSPMHIGDFHVPLDCFPMDPSQSDERNSLKEVAEILVSLTKGSAEEASGMATPPAPQSVDDLVINNKAALGRLGEILEGFQTQSPGSDHQIVIMAGLIVSAILEQYTTALKRASGCAEEEFDSDYLRHVARVVRGEIHHVVHVVTQIASCINSPSPGEAQPAAWRSVFVLVEANLRSGLRQLSEDTAQLLRSI